MSLVTSASIWTNDDNNQPKKRVSSLRKTIKLKPLGEPDDYNQVNENLNNEIRYLHNQAPSTITDTQNATQDRNDRVNEMLTKITAIDNGDSNMGDYKPKVAMSASSGPIVNPLLSKTLGQGSHGQTTYGQTGHGQPTFSQGSQPTFSNYNTSYDGKITAAKPYYATMGMGNSPPNDKMLEKINYLITMMEQNQMEKTSNITEEFILYTFLGVFVVFVIDSFSRAAKYTR